MKTFKKYRIRADLEGHQGEARSSSIRTTPKIQFAKSDYYPDRRTNGRTPDFLISRMEKALRAITLLEHSCGMIMVTDKTTIQFSLIRSFNHLFARVLGFPLRPCVKQVLARWFGPMPELQEGNLD